MIEKIFTLLKKMYIYLHVKYFAAIELHFNIYRKPLGDDTQNLYLSKISGTFFMRTNFIRTTRLKLV